MQKKSLLKSLLAVALAGLMLSAPITVMSKEVVRKKIPSNPVYHPAKGATWDRKGAYTGGKKDQTDWSYVYFGSYPQTEIKDTDLKKQIDKALGGAKVTGDVFVGDTKYRKVAPTDANYDGYWEKDETGLPAEKFRYFKWEPIVWKVLQVEENNNRLFLFSDKALDCQEYQKRAKDATWENCNLRAWLNDSDSFTDDPDRTGFTGEPFIKTAFSEEEIRSILQTELETKENPDYHTPGGNNTTDQIFLLSYEEVTNRKYGFCDVNDYDSTSRSVGATDYAVAMGAYRDTSEKWFNGRARWALRSPGPFTFMSMRCKEGGTIARSGTYNTNSKNGIVPALCLQLSSDDWYIKTSSTASDDEKKQAGADPELQETVALSSIVKIRSVKNNKAGIVTIRLKVEKKDPEEAGYEVVYATSKKKLSKAKKARTFTTSKFKLKKLKRDKTYYIRIRAFGWDVTGNKIYGKWCKIKKLKMESPERF